RAALLAAVPFSIVRRLSVRIVAPFSGDIENILLEMVRLRRRLVTVNELTISERQAERNRIRLIVDAGMMLACGMPANGWERGYRALAFSGAISGFWEGIDWRENDSTGRSTRTDTR